MCPLSTSFLFFGLLRRPFTTDACFLVLQLVSNIHAIRNFGLWMGSLVVVNYLLVLTLFAAAMMVWDTYV